MIEFQMEENTTSKISYVKASMYFYFLKTAFCQSDLIFFMLVILLNVMPLREADVFKHSWISPIK